MAYTVYYNTPGTILTYSQMQSELASLASANSWTYQTFGQSENLRNIDGVIINPTGYKRTTLITGGIHGNEKWTVRGVLDLLNYFDANPSAINSAMRYIVIPVLNPDGYENNKRKNDNDYATDGLTPWPRSVDLNRNFPARWGEDGGTDPADTFYMGPQAESEAEILVYEGLFDSYAPDFVLDAHTPENAMYAEARYYPIRAASVASALSANEFPALAFSISDANGGTFGEYTWSTKNTEYYIFEAAATTTIHQEVNQFLCVAITLLDSFNNPDHRTNIFKRDATCVAHWRFNAGGTSGDIGFDDQININLTNYSTCTLNTTSFVEGDGSVLMSGASSHMAANDSALPSNFPLKYGSSNNKIGITGWWAPSSLPASGAHMALASKYSSTTVDQRSWMLSLANVSGTYYIRLSVGHTSGTVAEQIDMISFSPTANVPFFIGFSYDIATKAWAIELYDETARIGGATGTSTNTMVLTEARFALGASYYNGTTISAALKYYGWIDEVAVFNDTLSADKVAEIWAGEYGYVDYSAASATGTLAATLANSTSSSTGTVAISGALSQTLAGSTVSSAVNVPIVGALSQTLASSTLSATTSSGLSGALSSTLADASCASTGTTAIAGTLAAPLATSTIASTGAVTVSGALASTLADSTLSSGSSTAAVGALASTLQSATVSASGAVSVSGSLSATLADATLSAYFGDSTPAQLTATLASATMEATGEIAIMGALSAALQDAFASIAGTVDIDAECAAILADCSIVIAGSAAIVGGGSATLASATLSARAGVNLVPDALPSRIVRVARENRIIRA